MCIENNRNLEVIINGVPCWFTYRMKVDKSFLSVKKIHVSPLCQKSLILNDEIYLAMNNFKLFPNKFVHVKCVEERGLEASTKHLIQSYEFAKKIKSNVDMWF